MSNSPVVTKVKRVVSRIAELEDKIEALKAKLWDNTLDDELISIVQHGDEALREVMAKEGATCTLEEFEKMKKELNDLESKLVEAEGQL